MGFLGPGPVAFHVAHAAGFAEAVEQHRRAEGRMASPDRFVDLGTGGGIPGLVLAARWPGASAVLLDANEVRTETLRSVISTLGWDDRVQVIRARAEVSGRDPLLRGRFPVAVARGFGAPPVVAECAAPLLAGGGLLVVSEPPFDAADHARLGPAAASPASPPETGPGAWDTRRWPADGLTELGLEAAGWYHHGSGYQTLRLAGAGPERYPRREGVPAKRPLWRV